MRKPQAKNCKVPFSTILYAEAPRTGSERTESLRFATYSLIYGSTSARLHSFASVLLSRPPSFIMRSHDYWDPQTSTVDWCESNYTVTRYCAEAINASTNILFLYLGLKGITKYRHNLILLISYISYLTISIKSFLFHTTLNIS